ncbi:MAG: hypothetical protein U0R50_07800 [Gaiellales bacterium]
MQTLINVNWFRLATSPDVASVSSPQRYETMRGATHVTTLAGRVAR